MSKGVEVVGDETVYCCVVRSWLLDRDGLGEMAQSESHQAQDALRMKAERAVILARCKSGPGPCPMWLSSQGLVSSLQESGERNERARKECRCRSSCISGGCNHSIGFILRISFASSSPETPADPYHEADSCAILSDTTGIAVAISPLQSD